MAIDFEMTADQRKLKYAAREFAREVLRPVAERADAIADPQQAFVAMKPVFEAAHALGYTTSFLPAEYGGGGASIVDTLIVTEELAAVDGGIPDHPPGQRPRPAAPDLVRHREAAREVDR